MKNIFIVIVTLFLLSPVSVYASDSPFDIRINSTYTLKEAGKTQAEHEISIRNITTEKFAESIDITLSDILYDSVVAYENGVKLAVSSVSTNPPVYKIVFIDKVVGRDQVRKFILQTEDHTSMKKAGEVWEVRLPTILGDFNRKRLTVKADKSLGEIATVRPEPTKLSDTTIFFENVGEHEIFLVFGKFQVLTFELGYDLVNRSNASETRELPVPPDTAYQRVHLTNITPTPTNMRLDDDGNWIAQYSLSAGQKIHVVARGSVQVYESPIHFLNKPTTTDTNIGEAPFWETTDSQLLAVANNLTDARSVYDYVVNHLSYDYQRAQTDGKRMGALAAFQNPESALCQEFSDLFVTLMRAKGIPARVVNGYAVVDDERLTPLSQKGDVLHAWPEYWDKDRGLWVAVDPTWGKTSGLNYFDRMDFKRIAFVMHGESSELPLPPGSFQLEGSEEKLISVSIGTWNQDQNQVQVSLTEESRFSLFTLSFIARVANVGTTAFYNQRVTIKTDKSVISDSVVPVLLPYSQLVYPLRIKAGILGNSLPQAISIVSDESARELPISKSGVTMTQLPLILLILTLAAITIVVVVPRHRKFTLKHFLRT